MLPREPELTEEGEVFPDRATGMRVGVVSRDEMRVQVRGSVAERLVVELARAKGALEGMCNLDLEERATGNTA